MERHSDLSPAALAGKIRRGEIALGGNRRLKIYGTLRCTSGKKLLPDNRVFFPTEEDAVSHGYRPCGHCLREQYKKWKDGTV